MVCNYMRVYVCVYVCVVVCTCEPVLGQDRWALEMRLSLPDLVEEWGVKLGLQLLVAVTLHDLSYFLFPPHMRRVVQVTFQTLSSAHVDDCLAHEKPWERGENTQLQWLKKCSNIFHLYFFHSLLTWFYFCLQTLWDWFCFIALQIMTNFTALFLCIKWKF